MISNLNFQKALYSFRKKRLQKNILFKNQSKDLVVLSEFPEHFWFFILEIDGRFSLAPVRVDELLDFDIMSIIIDFLDANRSIIVIILFDSGDFDQMPIFIILFSNFDFLDIAKLFDASSFIIDFSSFNLA